MYTRLLYTTKYTQSLTVFKGGRSVDAVGRSTVGLDPESASGRGVREMQRGGGVRVTDRDSASE